MSESLVSELAGIARLALLDEQMAAAHGYVEIADIIAERLAAGFQPCIDGDGLPAQWYGRPVYVFNPQSGNEQKEPRP